MTAARSTEPLSVSSAHGTYAGARWYVGHTLPRKEALARVHLERQGFATFLPQILVTRRHARQFDTVKAALFPRYLFIRLDLAQHRWRSVNGTVGMAQLVTTNDCPCPVPSGVVEALRAHAEGDLLRAIDPLQPGDLVRVMQGPFAGSIGNLLRLDPKGRVEILLDLLNGSVRLKLARHLLQAAA